MFEPNNLKTTEDMVNYLRKDNKTNIPLEDKIKNSVLQITNKKPTLTEDLTNLEDAFVKVSDTKYVSKYPTYYKGLNNEDFYGKNQGTIGKWFNGVTKNTLKAASYVVDGTVGTLVGVVNGMKEGSLDAVWNNDFSKFLDEQNKRLDYKLPNYITNEEKNMSFLRSMGTANFWANDVLGGVAFMAGAIGSEAIWAAATGGSSLALAGAKYGLRAGALGAKLVGQTERYSIAAKKALKAYNRSINMSKTGAAINNARFLLTSAGFESGVESRQSLDESLAIFQDNILKAKNRNPTAEEYQSFLSDAVENANKVFLANMAIVGTSNFLQFGRLFGIGGGLSSKVSNTLNKTLFGVGVTMVDGVATAIKPKNLQKLIGKTYNILKNPVIEGTQEGLQGTVSRASQNLLASKYDPAAMKENYTMWQSLKDGFEESFTSKEGFKEVGIGMIIGKLGGHVKGRGLSLNTSDYRNYVTELNNQESIADEINKSKLTLTNAEKKAIDNAMLLNQQVSSTNKASDLAEKGFFTEATLEYQNAQFSYMTALNRAGLLEDGLEDTLKSIDLANNEAIMAEYKVNENVVSEFKAKLKEKVIEDTERFKKVVEVVDALAPTVKNFEDKGGKARDFKLELANNMFLGLHAMDNIESLSESLEKSLGKNGFASTLSYYTKLSKEQKNIVSNISKKKKRIKELEDIYSNLQQEFSSLQDKSKRVEENVNLNNKIEKNREKALKVQEQKDKLNSELTSLKDIIKNSPLNSKFTFQNLVEKQEIDIDSLSRVDEELSKLDSYIDNLSKKDKQSALAVQHLVSEISKNAKMLEDFHNVFEKLTDTNFNYKKYKGIAKLINNKSKYEKPKNSNTQLEQVIENSELDEYDAFQVRLFKDVFESVQESNFTIEDIQDNIDNETWNNFVNNNIVDKTVLELIAEKDTNKEPLSNREQKIKDRNEEEVKNIKDVIKKKKGDKISNKINKLTPNLEAKTNKEKIIDLINQIKNNKNYLSEFKTEDVSEKDMPTEDEYREYNRLKRQKNLSAKKSERLKELETKIKNWSLIEGSQIGEDNLSSLYEQLFALESIEDTDETEDFKEIVEEDDIISGEALEVKQNKWYYNILQFYDKVFIKPILRNINGNIVKGVTIHNIGIGQFAEQLAKTLPNVTKVNVKGKQVKIEKIFQDPTFNSPVTIFYEKDGVEQRIDLGLNESKEGVQGIFTTILEDSVKRINEDSGLQIMSTAYQQDSPTTYKTLYKKLEDGKLVAIESPFERRSANTSETQKLKTGQTLKARVDLGNNYNQILIKKLRKGEITEEEFKRGVVIYMESNSGVLAGELKEEHTTDEPTSHKEKLTELRQKVYDTILEEVDNIDNLSNQEIEVETDIKIKNVFVGHPILEMRKISNDKVEVRQFPITNLDNVVDVGYIENGKIVTRNQTEKVKESFVKAILKGSKKFEGKRTPIIIIYFKGHKIAYPVSLTPTKQNLSLELKDIYENDNMLPTEKVIAINELLNNLNLNTNTLGVTTQDYIDKEESLLNIVTDINVYPKVNNFTSKDLSLEEILVGNVTTNINLEGDMFHSPKVVLDFGEEKDVQKVEEQTEEFEETGEVYEETSPAQETQVVEETTQEPISDIEAKKADIERIANISDPELRKAEEIRLIMSNLFSGVGEASANKIKEYVDRILSGRESRSSVVKDLSKSFVEGIDALLKANNFTEKVKEDINLTIVPNYDEIEELKQLPNLNDSKIYYEAQNKLDEIDFTNKNTLSKEIGELLSIINSKTIPEKQYEQVLKTKEKLIGNNNYFSKDYLQKYILYTTKDFSKKTEANIQTAQYTTYDSEGKPITKNAVVKNISYKENGNTDTITLEFEDGKTQTIKNYTNNFLPNALKLDENVLPLQIDMENKKDVLYVESKVETDNATINDIPQSIITKSKEELNKKCKK